MKFIRNLLRAIGFGACASAAGSELKSLSPLQEGYIRKGGQNPISTLDRPAKPSAFRPNKRPF